MLTVENLSYALKDGRVLLDTISCAFQQGHLTVLMGANGAGKSTFFKTITGELPNVQGRIAWNGQLMHQIDPKILSKTRAILRQHYEIQLPFNAYEIIEMGRYPHFSTKPTVRCTEVINEVAKYVGVEQLLERNYLTLSGGEQQRVQLARILAQVWDAPTEDRLILLDEPVSALDIQHQHQLLELISNLAKQKKYTVIAILHDLNLCFQYADEVMMMKKGQIVCAGPIGEVMTEKNIHTTFNVDVEIRTSSEVPYVTVKRNKQAFL